MVLRKKIKRIRFANDPYATIGSVASIIFTSILLGILALVLMITLMPHKGDVIIYDCSLSEISPDIPIEVKNQCRKLNLEKFKK